MQRAGSLVPVAQPYHPLMMSSQAITDVRYKLNILETLRIHGSNTRTATIRKCRISHRMGVDALNELVEAGLVDDMELRGDRTWVSINKCGKEALTLWTQLINLLIGGETNWL